MIKSKWSDEIIVAELRQLIGTTDFMPTFGYIRSSGRNDLACAITKRGGWKKFSQLMNVPMTPSDTLKGWAGEDVTEEWLYKQGYEVSRQPTRAHFDILLNGILRVDVKAASYAKYGNSSGWFYRMGKIITADVVICARMDKGDFYVFPWFRVPSTNLTITPTGKAHSHYLNNTRVIEAMLANRKKEALLFPECKKAF